MMNSFSMLKTDHIKHLCYSSDNDAQLQKLQTYVDVEKLENELVLTTAEYSLSLANVKWTYTGNLYF